MSKFNFNRPSVPPSIFASNPMSAVSCIAFIRIFAKALLRENWGLMQSKMFYDQNFSRNPTETEFREFLSKWEENTGPL